METRKLDVVCEKPSRDSLTHFRYKLHSGWLYNLTDPFPAKQIERRQSSINVLSTCIAEAVET